MTIYVLYTTNLLYNVFLRRSNPYMRRHFEIGDVTAVVLPLKFWREIRRGKLGLRLSSNNPAMLIENSGRILSPIKTDIVQPFSVCKS